LFYRGLAPITPRTVNIAKEETPFFTDSFDHTVQTLKGPTFLKDLQLFSENDKDSMTEETIELLEPYIKLQSPSGRELFTPEIAAKANGALKGLATWAAAMSDYHIASKIVKPKLKLLDLKTASL